MSNPNRNHLNAVRKCVLVAALLASAGVLAGSPAEKSEADVQQTRAPAARAEAVQPDQSLPRTKAAVNSTRKESPTRVFLEDFERVHRQVKRQYPTETYWVGKNPQSK